MNKQVESLLSEHGIQPTPNRMVVLDALLAAASPVTMTELEAQIGTMDKSSIFRVLCLFHDHRLVHLIDGLGGTMSRYEVCHSHDGDHDTDQHVHFACNRCGRVFCLENLRPEPMKLPDGFVADEITCTLHGLCPRCSGL